MSTFKFEEPCDLKQGQVCLAKVIGFDAEGVRVVLDKVVEK